MAGAATEGAREEGKVEAVDLAGNCAPCRKKTGRRRAREGPTLTCYSSISRKELCLPGEQRGCKYIHHQMEHTISSTNEITRVDVGRPTLLYGCQRGQRWCSFQPFPRAVRANSPWRVNACRQRSRALELTRRNFSAGFAIAEALRCVA